MKFRSSQRLWIAFLLGTVLTLGAFFTWRGCRQPPVTPDSKAPLSTTVYLGWLYSGAYGGEALAAEKYGPASGIRITLQPGGPGLDPLRLVSDGTFGVASADEVIRLVERGAEFVIVGVLNEDAPAAFAALESSNITKPTDMIGRRVGILPFGSTGLIYQALLARQNIKRDQIIEVPISPDLRPFITGATHDVQPVYVYDETVSLDKQNIRYTLIHPRAYGVSFKGPVYFTTKNTVEKQPELVKRFVRATILGWQAANASPEDAITSLKKLAPSLEEDREVKVLKRALPYYIDGERKLLTSKLETWNPMIDDMVAFKVIKRRVEPAALINLSFVDAVHADLKSNPQPVPETTSATRYAPSTSPHTPTTSPARK